MAAPVPGVWQRPAREVLLLRTRLTEEHARTMATLQSVLGELQSAPLIDRDSYVLNQRDTSVASAVSTVPSSSWHLHRHFSPCKPAYSGVNGEAPLVQLLCMQSLEKPSSVASPPLCPPEEASFGWDACPSAAKASTVQRHHPSSASAQAKLGLPLADSATTRLSKGARPLRGSKSPSLRQSHPYEDRSTLSSNLTSFTSLAESVARTQSNDTEYNSTMGFGSADDYSDESEEEIKCADSTPGGSSLRQAGQGKSTITENVPKMRLRLRECWLIEEGEMHELENIGDIALQVSNSTAAKRLRSKPSAEITTSRSEYKEKRPFGVLHPVGPQKMTWVCCSIMLIAYDMLTVPMFVFPMEENGATRIVDWIITVFWTLDIVINFRTAYFVKSDLEVSPINIAKYYMRTWLVPDLLIVCLEWASRFAGMVGGAGVLRFTRSLRSIRAIRLVRLAKLNDFTHIVEEKFNSVVVRLFIVLLKLTLGLLIVIHLATCGWYFIGDQTNRGWVTYVAVPECGQLAQELPEIPDMQLVSGETALLYFHSARWVLAQMNGRTDQDARRNLIEMMYTCIVAVFGPLVAMSVFVSLITQNMMELSNITGEERANRQLLMKYLSERKISEELAVALKMHVRFHKDLQKEAEGENAVLAMLTKQMRKDLLYEVRAPILVLHPLFHFINRDHKRVMMFFTSHTLQSVLVHKGEHVFEKGDACQRMLFTSHGVFMYDDRQKKSQVNGEQLWSTYGTVPSSKGVSEADVDGVQELGKGTWVSEASLWLEWRNRGSLISFTDGCFLALEAATFADALRNFRDMLSFCRSYAHKFAREMKEQGTVSDIIDVKVIVSRTCAETGTAEVYQSENGDKRPQPSAQLFDQAPANTALFTKFSPFALGTEPIATDRDE